MGIYIVVWRELLIALLLGKVMNCPERYDVQGICYKLQDMSYEMWFKNAFGYKFLKLFFSFTGWAHNTYYEDVVVIPTSVLSDRIFSM